MIHFTRCPKKCKTQHQNIVFTSRLCLTSQLYPKNISILFKFITNVFILSMYPSIFSSSGVNLVTFPFLVPSVLKILNNLSIGFILIFLSFTSCLLISVQIHLKLINVLSHNFFPFEVFTFVCMLSSLSLLFLLYGITY